MTLSKIGRISKALVVSMAVVLGMSACGGYTVGFMWVLGTQYNQIAGFKIDDYTGNLTAMVNSPYTSAGQNPVSIVVRAGGNFVFVVNKGTSTNGVSNHDGNVAVFAVGQDGVLTFQNTYTTPGGTPIWAVADGSGSYLYVLDAQAPVDGLSKLGDGSIAVYGIDGGTGRLQLVKNTSVKTGGIYTNYFEVGQIPTTFRSSGSCLFTLDGDQSIYAWSIGSNGQLSTVSTALYKPGTTNLTSINVSGSYVFLTDAGNGTTDAGRILPYTAGSGCTLSVQAAGAVSNLALTADPVYSMTDAKNKFLYVLNQKTTDTSKNAANSTISAFAIQTTGTLLPISDTSNPYGVGNGPVCMVEDPSNQYLYTSNGIDGTVTGKFINQNTGQLSSLSRGSVFQAFPTGGAACLVVSGSVD